MKIFMFGRTEPIGRNAYLIHLLACALLFGGCFALSLHLGKDSFEFITFMIAFFVLMEWSDCLKSRMQDTGISRWYSFPILFVPYFVCVLLVIHKVLVWPYALALFVFTQIPFGFLRQKPKPA
jgi:uncharacterized membrane protein YhaH (DUF805 family)